MSRHRWMRRARSRETSAWQNGGLSWPTPPESCGSSCRGGVAAACDNLSYVRGGRNERPEEWGREGELLAAGGKSGPVKRVRRTVGSTPRIEDGLARGRNRATCARASARAGFVQSAHPFARRF